MCRAMPFSARALNKNIPMTWWDGHVCVQNNSKLWHMFCIIIESNCRKTFSSTVLYTNMAAVTSGENHLSTTNTPHYSFPKHFFLLFLHVERVCKSHWNESLTRTRSAFYWERFEKSIDKRFPMQKWYTTVTVRDSSAQMFFSRHFHRTIENMNRSKIVRFPANFTPEITLKVSWQQKYC